MRDARIAAIYEGTNGVQAIDLVQRKLPLSGGATVAREIAGMRAVAAEVAARGGAAFGATAQRLTRGGRRARAARPHFSTRRSAPIRRTRWPARRLISGCSASRSAAPASPRRGSPRKISPRAGDSSQLGRVALARFFAEKIATARRRPGRRPFDRAPARSSNYEAALAEAT